jgi:hypothetical protein
VDPNRLDPRLAKATQTEEAFARYDTNGDGNFDVRELKNALRDLQVTLSDDNIMKLQKEIDVNGDGIVSLHEVTTWWVKKQKGMTDYLFADPTAKWGNSPATTSREVGWFVARRAETSTVRRANQAKWRLPKQTCEECLYATEYVKFAGQSPFSNKGKEGPAK